MPETNYARHVGGVDPAAGHPKVKATKEVIFFSGDIPLRCEPQEHWAFYRRTGLGFRGKVIGESNS